MTPRVHSRSFSAITLVLLVLLILRPSRGETSPPELYHTWGTFGSAPGQFRNPRGLAVDSAGNVFVADRANDRVQKFNGNGQFITSWGTSGSGDGQFTDPVGIAVDGSGNVFVTDFSLHRVQKFNGATGGFLAKWGGFGSANGQFNLPSGIAVDDSGQVYVGDTANNRIQKFSGAGAYLAKWGVPGTGSGQFDRPYGITVARDGSTATPGEVFVGDRFNERIQVFTTSGAFLRTWGAAGAGPGGFSFPDGLAVGPNGDVYVADWDQNRIQRFRPDGTFVEEWGSPGSAPGQFNGIGGIAIDAAGSIYAGDYLNNRIQLFCNCNDPLNVPAGFEARVLAGVPVPSALRGFAGIAVPPSGSSFAAGVYAAFATYQTDGAGSLPDDFLYRIGYDGSVTQILAFPQDDTDPIDLEFGVPGGMFAGKLYVSANNYDNHQVGDRGGAILAVEPSTWNLSEFFPNDNALISEPRSLALAPSSVAGFPADLYVTNPNPPHQLFTLTSSGSPGSFTLDGPPMEGLAFGNGGAFGTNLYVGTEDGSIYRADTSGGQTLFTNGLNGRALRLQFGPGGGFGTKLYAMLDSGSMVTIDPSGAITPFLSGLCSPYGTWNDFAFSPDGLAMYLTDAGGRRVHEIGLLPATADPAQCSSGWDGESFALVTPGTQSSVDELAIVVRDANAFPIPGVAIEVVFSGCTNLCIDAPVAGLTGVTDASGAVVLNPRVGGCDTCDIEILAAGIPVRSYPQRRVISTDWDGSQADGVVGPADSVAFVAALGTNNPCFDYSGDGFVNLSDIATFSTSYFAGDANLTPCLALTGQFRRACSGACPAGGCVGASAGLEGSCSLWVGVPADEAQTAGWIGGRGYGNNWVASTARTFTYGGTGSVTLSFDYSMELEAGFDFASVTIDTSGSGCGGAGDVVLALYDGISSGTASFTLNPGVELPNQPGPITILFRVETDGAGSDEDGLFDTNCGAFAVDAIRLTGAITHYADFEVDDGGWLCQPGPACGVPSPVPCPGPDTWIHVSGPTGAGSAGAPVGRRGHAMAADATGHVVLFGGVGASSHLNDTWIWSGAGWQVVNTPSAPLQRAFHAMSFDASRNRVVLFGGSLFGVPLGDTWEWDGSTWSLVASTGPSPRYGHVMAYDAVRMRTVLFGGTDGAVKGDTWTWDGHTWSLASGSGPAPRRSAAAVYDPGLGRIVLQGGEDGAIPQNAFDDTWEWDGTAWTEADTLDVPAHPGARSRHAMAYARDCARPTLYGGGGSGNVLAWRWRGAEWRADPNPGPGARREFAMAYDAVSQRVMLFGGADYADPPGVYGDTWELCGPCDMEAAPLDSLGNVILPPNIDPSQPVVESDAYEARGNVGALYPGLDTSTDLWFKDLPCPAAVGGMLPREVSVAAIADSLSALYPGVTFEEIADSLASWENQIVNDVQGEVDSLLLLGSVSQGYVPPPIPHAPDDSLCYIFGGRDIVFVHGYQTDPILDKVLDPLGIGPASVKWRFGTTYPANSRNPSFYDANGYWKKNATDYWELHIQKFLRDRGIKNRYLIVAWPSTERLHVGALAILTQISDAMNHGLGVVDPTGRNNQTKFGSPSFVLVSHSTGGLVTDVAMSAANTFPAVLNAKFVPDHCKAQIAVHDAFSGSGWATMAVAVSRAVNQIVLPWACDAVKKGLFPKRTLPGCVSMAAIEHSVLRDLVPRVSQWRWGLLVATTPVRTLTVSGAHPAGIVPGVLYPLKHVILPGFDDGTLNLNSQAANPNFSSLWPVSSMPLWPSGFFTFPALGMAWNYDMGIQPVRAVPLAIDQAIDPYITGHPFAPTPGYWMASGANPHLSPTGMRQSILFDPDILNISGTPLGLGGRNRHFNHYSFLESPSDHFDSTPGYSDSATAFDTYPHYRGVFGFQPNENGEETRVITSTDVYQSYSTGEDAAPQPLLTSATVPQVEEVVRGRSVTFRWFGNARVRWWIWRRTYYVLQGWQTRHEMDYVYASVLSGGGTYPDSLSCASLASSTPEQAAAAFSFRLASSNPSRGATRFELTAPAPGNIEATVYDVGGRVVQTLRTTDVAVPGRVAITWGGFTDRGSPAASGIYFLRARFLSKTGTARAAQAKFILLR